MKTIKQITSNRIFPGLVYVSLLTAVFLAPAFTGISDAAGLEIKNAKATYLLRDAYEAIVPATMLYPNDENGYIEVYPTLTADVVTSPGGSPVSADWETVLYSELDTLIDRQLFTGTSVTHTASQVIHTLAGPSYRWAMNVTQGSNTGYSSIPVPISSWVAVASAATGSASGKVKLSAETRIVTERVPVRVITTLAEPENVSFTLHKIKDGRSKGTVLAKGQLTKVATGKYSAEIDLPAGAKGADMVFLAEIQNKAGEIQAQDVSDIPANIVGTTKSTPAPTPTPTAETTPTPSITSTPKPTSKVTTTADQKTSEPTASTDSTLITGKNVAVSVGLLGILAGGLAYVKIKKISLGKLLKLSKKK